jgi:TetR/AcrR family tetracycline transcriptional repressor
MKVDRARILDEALSLLNEVGVDGLTTRMLAARLGVQQPALYWHFRNKRALLDAMNEEILARRPQRALPASSADWRAFLEANAGDFRDALTAWRDGGRVHAGTEAGPHDLDRIEAQLRFLTGVGFTPTIAMDLVIAISRYTVGCVVEEQAEGGDEASRQALEESARDYPLTDIALRHYRTSSHKAAFERGLRMLLDGAEAALEGMRRGDPLRP